MQQAKQNSIASFGYGVRGERAAQATLSLAVKSGDRVAVPGLATAQVSGLRRAVVPAIPPSLLASACGVVQLRRDCAAAIAVPSSSQARHNNSLQRTAWPPAELAR